MRVLGEDKSDTSHPLPAILCVLSKALPPMPWLNTHAQGKHQPGDWGLCHCTHDVECNLACPLAWMCCPLGVVSHGLYSWKIKIMLRRPGFPVKSYNGGRLPSLSKNHQHSYRNPWKQLTQLIFKNSLVLGIKFSKTIKINH